MLHISFTSLQNRKGYQTGKQKDPETKTTNSLSLPLGAWDSLSPAPRSQNTFKTMGFSSSSFLFCLFYEKLQTWSKAKIVFEGCLEMFGPKHGENTCSIMQPTVPTARWGNGFIQISLMQDLILRKGHGPYSPVWSTQNKLTLVQ